MARCQSCGSRQFHIDLVGGLCDACRERIATEQAAVEAASKDEALRCDEAAAAIILSTEASSGLPIAERLGIVAAECVYGLAITKDIASAVRNIVGGRNAGVQKAINEARRTVLQELRHEAVSVQADAVVGISVTYNQFSGDGGWNMLLCVATGTAVRLSDAAGTP